MQAAYTNFPQPAGDHFQLQSPNDVPTMIMDDLRVRNSLYSNYLNVGVHRFITNI